MSKKNKIWLVSELFYPETISTGYIMTEIAKYLSKENQVAVISGSAFYEKRKEKDKKILSNIEIHRVNGKGYDKNRIISRFIGHLKTTYGMLNLMRKHIPSDSEVLLVTNPILLVIFVTYFSVRKKWRVKLLIHDVFPENLVVSGLLKSKKSLFFSILEYIFSRSFNKVDELIVLGRDMKSLFEKKVKKNKRITIIENWSDTENIHSHPILDSKLKTFLFAGNMGRLQGIDTLLEAIKNVKLKSCNFIFIGNGALDNYIKEYIRTNELNKVKKIDWINREQQDDFMANATVGIVTLKKNMHGLGVPSKFYNLIAAGKPIFYIGDINSELYLVLKEFEIGWFAEAGNVDMITDVISKINNTSLAEINRYSVNARKLAEEKYSKEIILNKFGRLFSNK